MALEDTAVGKGPPGQQQQHQQQPDGGGSAGAAAAGEPTASAAAAAAAAAAAGGRRVLAKPLAEFAATRREWGLKVAKAVAEGFLAHAAGEALWHGRSRGRGA
jgi:hypothetical protein